MEIRWLVANRTVESSYRHSQMENRKGRLRNCSCRCYHLQRQYIARELVVPYDLFRVLDEQRSAPAGMVRVAGAKTSIGPLEDFYIDRYEVTNLEYKKIDSGGYRKKEYWKHVFTENGKTLSWEEAMARFMDQTGRAGPAGWQAGVYPAGQSNYPVGGISWYEAAAYEIGRASCRERGESWGGDGREKRRGSQED